MADTIADDAFAALRLPEFRCLLSSIAIATIASRAMVVVIGYQVFDFTGDPLSIAWLGLVEVIPAVSLALYGGYVADHHARRNIVLATDAMSILCAVLFVLISARIESLGVMPLYAVVFLAGIARGFADPAAVAFEAQVVPRALYINAATWISSTWQACAIIGPILGGYAYALIGVTNTYTAIAVLFAIAWCFIWMIAPKPKPEVIEGESIWESVSAGLKFVFSDRILVGSMALDLFAVLFGGAMALLPVFAKDIFRIGPAGVGLLNAAPSVGALSVMLWSTMRPPVRHAGRNLLVCVAGFGVSMIVFALSENFWLSIVALSFSGACDGVSVVIRKSILRMRSPDHMRGRVSAVGSIFISSSNELGAFESGLMAKLLGTVRSVWMGGILTLVIVGLTAWNSPELRRLSLSSPPPEK